MPTDPIIGGHIMGALKWNMWVGYIGVSVIVWTCWLRLQSSHRFVTYKGPDAANNRVRHRRFPAGYAFYGWGNNGLNRDCNLKEYECWAGYMGKEYTY
jgi:hypothetical protein